jgi:hypothetical protein
LIRTEVLANYTISDYEEQVASVKSFSFRQAFWYDSTVVQISNKIQFKFIGSLRIYERGILRWKEFKERPEDYFVEKAWWPELFWSDNTGISIGIGYRFFNQNRYKYRGSDRIFDLEIETMGPTVELEWNGLGRSHVSMIGWREVQKSNGIVTATIANLSIKVEYVL